MSMAQITFFMFGIPLEYLQKINVAILSPLQKDKKSKMFFLATFSSFSIR